jgi:hypothetical protein
MDTSEQYLTLFVGPDLRFRHPIFASARAAQCGTDRSEFALQDAGKIGDHQHQRADDKAKKDDIFRHRRPVFVFPNFIDELQNLRHDRSPPYRCYRRIR